ncbi:glycosyltransferase [Patescibacteria group bacterium]|nr:glycosyltransferase [Patescibacteria group bacterium]
MGKIEKDRKMTKHLIIASYDGINAHYCGVGTIIRNTIFALKDFAGEEGIKVSLAYISADPKGKVFNNECFKDSVNLVKNTGGHLISLCNGTAGFDESDMWKSFPEWKNACASLSTALNMILDDKDDNVLMLHDTPFLLFTKFKQQIFGKNLRCFYIPHSSGLNHAFGDDKWRNKRIEIEREAFQAIRKDDSSRLLAEGRNFAKHLIKDYDVTFEEDAYLTNGLYFDRYKEFLNHEFDISDLNKFGINIDPKSKIIFSWGRCSTAKGFKELLEVWQGVVESLPDYHLIIQTPNNSGEDNYFRSLKEYEQNIPRTIIIDDFNPKIWQTMLRIKNTDIVCIPSVMDPNPHTAIEAKLFSTGMRYVIVASNVDGVKDTYTDDECLYVNPYSKEDFSSGLLKASRLNEEERRKMNETNAKNLSNYDYSKKIRDFLKRIKLL